MKKLYKKIMIVLFALFMLIMPALTLIFMSPEPEPFSENENRYLARFPKLSFETYQNEKFMNGFDDWISDRFFGREEWIVLKNSSDKLIGKTEFNGVFIEDGMMMQIWKEYDKEIYERNLNSINGFLERHTEMPTYFMLVPNAQEIYADSLPPFAQVSSQKDFIDQFYSSLKNISGTIDAYSMLKDNKDSYIYYRTDHHWTSYGAYLAYKAAAPVLGYEGIDKDKFNVEHVSDQFKGTLYSKTLDKSVAPDVMDYYILKENEPDVKVSVFREFDPEQGKILYDEYDSMYFREFLNVKDKYASFLGQNTPIVTVENENAENNRSLLIIKDSYAHSIVPFLSKEYSKVTMLDLRYIQTDFQNMISLEDYDQLLFLYNVITFSEDESNIVKLNMCK